MTKQEAIETIKLALSQVEWDYPLDYAAAFDMAISAMEKQDATDTNVDTINRQAAIDTMCSACGYECDKSEFIYNAPQDEQVILCPEHYALTQLPSAQPEQRWIPCSDRLPDVAQRVLLSGHGQVMVGMLHSFGKFSLEPTGISHVYPKDDIEAWMPLPEPYKVESEE